MHFCATNQWRGHQIWINSSVHPYILVFWVEIYGTEHQKSAFYQLLNLGVVGIEPLNRYSGVLVEPNTTDIPTVTLDTIYDMIYDIAILVLSFS